MKLYLVSTIVYNKVTLFKCLKHIHYYKYLGLELCQFYLWIFVVCVAFVDAQTALNTNIRIYRLLQSYCKKIILSLEIEKTFKH